MERRLFNASRDGNLEEVKKLLDQDIDVNFCCRGLTSLMTASSGGHLEIVQELLDHGAHIDETTSRGATSLMFAVCQGHLDVVQELLNRGADPNRQIYLGNSYMIGIATKQNQRMLKILSEAGTDTDAVNSRGQTAQDLAKKNFISMHKIPISSIKPSIKINPNH